MTEALDKAEQFIKSVEGLAVLLRGISMESVAEAIKDERCERETRLYEERNKAWVQLFREMANDMNSTASRLESAKVDMESCSYKTKQAIKLFNGAEFKEATNSLERFVSLCERFQSLKSTGFLDQVIETIGRV